MIEKLDKNIQQMLVHKPNQLIEVIGTPLSTKGLLVYNFLLHKLQTLKTDKLIISMSEIFKSLDISDKYEQIYEYLDTLQKVRVESRDIKGRVWGAFNLLAVFHKRDDGIFIQIPDPIYKALCGNSEQDKTLYYTTIKLLEQRLYSCAYTLIFDEIFKKYEKVNLPSFTIEELKELTGTTDKYQEYKYFKRDVLTKAIDELNKFDTTYVYSFTEKRIGRKVSEIKFNRKEKKKASDTKSEPINISKKLLLAIKKAKRNIYISKVYSQKAIDNLLLNHSEDIIIKALKEVYKYNKEIQNFTAFMKSKVSDIDNSSNKAIDEKLFKLEEEDIYADKTEDDFIQVQLFNQENVTKLIKELDKLDEYSRLNILNNALNKHCKDNTEELEALLKLQGQNNQMFVSKLYKELSEELEKYKNDKNNDKNNDDTNGFSQDEVKKIMLNKNKLDLSNITDTIKKQIIQDVENSLQDEKDKLLFKAYKDLQLDKLIDIYQKEFTQSFNKFHSKSFMKNAKVTMEVTKRQLEKKIQYVLDNKEKFIDEYQDYLLSKKNKKLYGTALDNRLIKLVRENVIKV